MPTAYEYDKLPSSTAIRLVNLEGGIAEDTLRCNIITTTLEAQSVYEALSYVWGDENDKPTIQIGTQHEDRQLCITKNLAAALRRLRYPSSLRVLWIDSICINQNDIEEKNLQVPLMGEIYRQASRVLVWLGDGPDLESTAKANVCIDRLSDAYQKIDEIED